MALARRASCENAARAHYYLVGFYWDRAYNAAASAAAARASLAS